MKLISSQLNEGKIKGGAKLAAPNDNAETFLIPNYEKMHISTQKKDDKNATNPKNIDSFFKTEFEVYKAKKSISNGWRTGRTRLFPKLLNAFLENQMAMRGPVF